MGNCGISKLNCLDLNAVAKLFKIKKRVYAGYCPRGWLNETNIPR